MFIDIFPLSQNVTIIFQKIQIFTKKNMKEFKLTFVNVNFAILTGGVKWVFYTQKLLRNFVD
jgi:hypothetical protein